MLPPPRSLHLHHRPWGYEGRQVFTKAQAEWHKQGFNQCLLLQKKSIKNAFTEYCL
jgi:hypothetical protein